MSDIREEFQRARRQWATTGGLLTEGEVKDALSEGRFGLKTDKGRLVNSLTTSVIPEGDGFKTGTNVIYGGAWERGFSRKAFDIVPRRAKAFMIPMAGGVQWIGKGGDATPGNVIFRKRVRIPAQTFAARPWLLPAILASYSQLEQLGEDIFDAALKRSFPDRTIQI